MKTQALLLALSTALVGGCSVVKNAEETRKDVGRSVEMQAQLLDRTRDQGLSLTCFRIVSPEDFLVKKGTSDMTRFMIFVGLSEKCAKYGTPLEIVKAAFALSNDLKEEPDSDERMDAQKNIYFALGALASEIPDDKFEEIVNDQIAHRGSFFTTANEMAALRFRFIEKYRIHRETQTVESNRVVNPALYTMTLDNLRESVNFYRKLKYLATSPHRDLFSFRMSADAPDSAITPRKDLAFGLKESEFWLENSYARAARDIRDNFEKKALEVDKNSEEAKRLLAELN